MAEVIASDVITAGAGVEVGTAFCHPGSNQCLEDVSKRCGHALPELCSLSLSRHFLRMQRSV